MIDYGTECVNPEEVIEYINKALKEQCDIHQIEYPLTVSIGYAVIDKRPTDIEQMLAAADEKLYEQKAKYRKEQLP